VRTHPITIISCPVCSEASTDLIFVLLLNMPVKILFVHNKVQGCIITAPVFQRWQR